VLNTIRHGRSPRSPEAARGIGPGMMAFEGCSPGVAVERIPAAPARGGCLVIVRLFRGPRLRRRPRLLSARPCPGRKRDVIPWLSDDSHASDDRQREIAVHSIALFSNAAIRGTG